MPAKVSFTGIANAVGAEMTLCRGVTPSVCTLWMVPQEHLNLPPGTLRFEDDAGTITFIDAAVDWASLRKHRDGSRPLWSVQIKDRRWRWELGTIGGEWNRRLPDGSIDPPTLQSTHALAIKLLDAMGESSYDVSTLPLGVYPYVNWKDTNPARALAQLLDKLGCCLILGLDNRVKCGPIGLGSMLPSGERRHIPLAHRPATRPSRLVLYGGPTIFQSRLALSAIGRETSGNQKLINDLTYEPSTTWYAEHPCILGSVTNDDEHRAALDDVFRLYRVTGQASGGLDPPGSPYTVASVEQYLLNTYLVESGLDLDGYGRLLPAIVDGDYWPYSDEPTDVTNTRFTGPFRILPHERAVEFPYPLFSLTTAGVPQQPTLYLTTAYLQTRLSGGLVRFEAARTLGGTGGDYLIRVPELFYSVRSLYSGSSLAGVVETSSAALSEAGIYLDIFQQRFAERDVGEAEYSGLLPLELDGVRAQVKWSCAHTRPALTHLSIMDEFDVYTKHERERRRGEQVAQLVEGLA